MNNSVMTLIKAFQRRLLATNIAYTKFVGIKLPTHAKKISSNILSI